MSDAVQPTAPAERTPASLSEIFEDLQGFGIEESDDIISISSGKRVLRIKFSNITSEDDLAANVATEEAKGYAHFQEIKIHILALAISWVNGVDLRKLAGADRLVTNPKTGEKVDYQAAMRKTIRGWGLEVTQILWKALMVHVQAIEDRLFESLPEATVMTQVERRYRERLEREQAELEDVARDMLKERVADLLDNDPTDEGTDTAGS